MVIFRGVSLRWREALRRLWGILFLAEDLRLHGLTTCLLFIRTDGLCRHHGKGKSVGDSTRVYV